MSEKVEIKQQLPQQFTDAQISFIKQKTPTAFIQKRQGPGGKMLDYVDIGYVVNMLNSIFGLGGWDFENEIVEKLTSQDEVVVKGRLTVRGVREDVVYSITKEQFGQAGKMGSLGDSAKGAASDALKKCASLIGIASDVYYPHVYSVKESLENPSETKVEPVQTELDLDEEPF
jgi:hypothetical protein